MAESGFLHGFDADIGCECAAPDSNHLFFKIKNILQTTIFEKFLAKKYHYLIDSSKINFSLSR